MIRLLFIISLALQSATSACLWDYDTLTDERRGLPGVAEIIAGRWERHSPAFYRQRIAAMEKLLADHPDDWAAWDNLAVAHEKVGETDQAIKVILEKDARSPGQYTTEANLGTFYMLGGDYERGVEHIRRAIAINPDAHFGREQYQLQLAEFLWHPPAADNDGAFGSFVLPLLERPDTSTRPSDLTVVDKMWSTRRLPGSHHRTDLDPAITGIIGMIRFGSAASPDLYYALGELLAARRDKNLAYRAYLRAIELKHPSAKEVRVAADAAKADLYEPGDLDAEFAAERKSADAWVAAYQAHEQALIATGRDAEDDANYADFYAKFGSPRPPLPWQWPKRSKETLIVGIAITALTGYLIVRLLQSWRRNLIPSPGTPGEGRA